MVLSLTSAYIKSESIRNGTFVFNRITLAAIRKLKDTAGQYVFQAGMMLSSGVPNSILGYPYVEATDMPDIASNAYPIAFGDFNRAYMIVDRINLAVLRDPFTQATTQVMLDTLQDEELVDRLFKQKLLLNKK